MVKTKKFAVKSTRRQQEDPDDNTTTSSATITEKSVSVRSSDDAFLETSMDEEEEDEEEDEIIEEIEVLINTGESSTNLNILQFPQKSANEKKSNSSWIPSEGRIRPVQNKLELDYPIAESSRYAKVRSEFGGSMPGMLHLQNRTYTSKTIPLKTHMAVGMIKDKTLVLFPLQTEVLQMRPSLEHVDRALGTLTPMEEEETKQSGRIELKAGTRQVFKESNRKITISSQRAQEESEEFLPLQIHPMGSAEWQAIRRNIETSLPPTNFLVRGSVESYIKSLNYLPSAPLFHDDSGINPDKALDIDNIHETTKMDIDDNDKDDQKEDEDVKPDIVTLQIQALSAKVTRFFLSSRGYPIPFPVIYQSLQLDIEQNRSTSTTNYSINDIPLLLTCLSGCAAMIRGSNFILKSSLLSGLSTELQATRTFILFLLNRDGIVYSESLHPTLGKVSSTIQDVEIIALLKLLAKKSSTNNCWTMKYDEDICFIEKYFPDEAAMFRRYWYKKETELGEYISAYDDFVMKHQSSDVMSDKESVTSTDA